MDTLQCQLDGVAAREAEIKLTHAALVTEKADFNGQVQSLESGIATWASTLAKAQQVG